MLTVAKGTSVIVETIFENRYRYINEIKRMGAKITIEGKMAVIKGVRKLSGAAVHSTDLRGGAAMVIAGLAASRKNNNNGYRTYIQGIRKIR